MTAPLRILVAEDDPEWRQLLSFWLGKAGYSVEIVGKAAGVLPAARRSAPDLFVLDQDLGDGTGHDVCRAIKADAALSGVPVIILTAKAGALPEVAASDPPDQFVAKTGEPDELLLVIAGLFPGSL